MSGAMRLMLAGRADEPPPGRDEESAAREAGDATVPCPEQEDQAQDVGHPSDDVLDDDTVVHPSLCVGTGLMAPFGDEVEAVEAGDEAARMSTWIEFARGGSDASFVVSRCGVIRCDGQLDSKSLNDGADGIVLAKVRVAATFREALLCFIRSCAMRGRKLRVQGTCKNADGRRCTGFARFCGESPCQNVTPFLFLGGPMGRAPKKFAESRDIAQEQQQETDQHLCRVGDKRILFDKKRLQSRIPAANFWAGRADTLLAP
jgi:hypothetical protein